MLSDNNLSRSEKEVLSVIYESEEKLSLRGVMELVNKKYNHKWKPQTVSTFLCRIAHKGYLESERKGRYMYYSPTIDWNTNLKNELKDIAYMYFNGDMEQLKKYINEI